MRWSFARTSCDTTREAPPAVGALPRRLGFLSASGVPAFGAFSLSEYWPSLLVDCKRDATDSCNEGSYLVRRVRPSRVGERTPSMEIFGALPGPLAGEGLRWGDVLLV